MHKGRGAAAPGAPRGSRGHPAGSPCAPGTCLLLLQSLDEGVLQPVGVLCLQCLLLVGSHALLAQDLAIFLLLPVRGEVGAALSADEGLHTQEGRAAFPCKAPGAGVKWGNGAAGLLHRLLPPRAQHQRSIVHGTGTRGKVPVLQGVEERPGRAARWREGRGGSWWGFPRAYSQQNPAASITRSCCCP